MLGSIKRIPLVTAWRFVTSYGSLLCDMTGHFCFRRASLEAAHCHFPHHGLNQLGGSLHHTAVYYVTCLGQYCFRRASLEAAPHHFPRHNLNQLGGSLHHTAVYYVTCLGLSYFRLTRLGSNYSLEYLTEHISTTHYLLLNTV